MTNDEIAMLITGQILVAGMFACGVLVGVSFRRKDASHDSDDEKAQDEGQRLKYFDSLR